MDPENEVQEPGQASSDSPTENTDSEHGASSTPSDSDLGSSPKKPASMLEAVSEALGGEQKEDKSTAADQSDGESDDGKSIDTKVGGQDGKETTASEADDLYASLPEGTKEATTERFNKMIESHKELNTRTETAEKDVADFREVITYSQATPEEFNELMEYSRMAKSGDLDGALALLDRQRHAIAQLLGKPVEGVDQLGEFPDLQNQVDEMDLPQEVALELAASRRREKLQQQQVQGQQDTQAAQRQQQQARATAQQQITQLGQQWAANDIDYGAKHDLLMKQAAVIAQAYPPEFWSQAMTDYYQTLQVQAKPAPDSKPNPLRPQGGGGGKEAPGSMLDAVNRSLGV